jgi:uncharacterized protein DUF4157
MIFQSQVARPSTVRTPLQPQTNRRLQRKCACGGTPGPMGECETCRKKREGALQRRPVDSATPDFVPPIVHEVLQTPGSPLETGTRKFMESRFNHDFSNVRIHRDVRAAESANAVSAHAYTVGHNVVFASGQYAPGTERGKRLLAHELTHVIQQGGVAPSADLRLGSPNGLSERDAESSAARVANGEGARVRPISGGSPRIDRDLATPHPKVKPAAQPPLTNDQIKAAIEFNSSSYDEANTKRIQNLVGVLRPTGTWDTDTIRLIALLQEEFGLTKDGRVDLQTFNFLQREQQLEGAPTTADRCLTAFAVTQFPIQQAVAPGPGGTLRLVGQHQINAQFSARCDCSKYQYRQFIQGTAIGTRGTATQDLAGLFPQIPGGRLPSTFQEDGNTSWASPNYGHRDQAGQATTTATDAENHYINDQNATDQTKGCRYRGEDYPKLTVSNLLAGDVVRVLVEFRGEIQRDGAPVQTKQWKDIDATVTIP